MEIDYIQKIYINMNKETIEKAISITKDINVLK